MNLMRRKRTSRVLASSVALDLDSEEWYKSKLKQILITHAGLTCISPSATVYRWMTWLGFRYAPMKKGYMLMDMKNLQQFNTDGISATISGLCTKDAQMDSDTSRGSNFHGREG
jgi:hypothetical protein